MSHDKTACVRDDSDRKVMEVLYKHDDFVGV